MASSLDIRRTYMNPEWAADLVTMRTQLDCKESENQALRLEVHTLRAHMQMYKDSIARLSAPRQMQVNTGSGQLLSGATQEEWENMQNELKTVKAQLERQTAICEFLWSNRTSSVAQSQPQAGPSSGAPQTKPTPHTNCSTYYLPTSSVAQSQPHAGPSSFAPQISPNSQPLPNETVKPELTLLSAGPPTLPHPSHQPSRPRDPASSSPNVAGPSANLPLSASRDQESGSPNVAGCQSAILPLSASTSVPSNIIMPQYAKPVATKEAPKTEDEDDLFVVQSSQPSYLSPLPEARRTELDGFPEFVPEADDVSSVFSRAHLSAVLGGNTQSLIVTIGASQKPLARERNVTKFLCPNLSQNPWCPRSAGTHGYMFVGLTTENETFLEPEQLNLFLSAPGRGKGPLEVTYLGIYEVARVQALTAEEWCTLSETVRKNYVETTASRGNSKGKKQKNSTPESSTKKVCSAKEMGSEYSQGLRHVPCVRLRCVGFDEALYAGLVGASRGNHKRSLGSTDSDRSPKRHRGEETSL